MKSNAKLTIKKTSRGVTKEEFEAYLGKSASKPFYQKSLNTYMDNPNKMNWNWASTFLSTYWFCYRKALIPAVISFSLIIISNAFLPSILGDLALLAILAFFGSYGTNIFFKDAERAILYAKKNSKNNDKNEILNSLTTKGKTSFILPLIFFIFEGAIYYNFIF